MFLVPALPPGDDVTLDGPEGHHAATVQRLRVGEALLVSDGHGGTAAGVVTAVGRGRIEARIEHRRYEPAPDPRLVVVQGIAKGERGEMAVQAMTEVGVDATVPWAAARSVARWQGERGDKARQRWVDVAREATKQARRAWLPQIAAAESTAAVGARLAKAGQSFVLHEEASTALATAPLVTSGDIVLVVGPEGGITPEELAAFTAAGAMPVRLGGNVLRTSTAGVASLAVLSARLGRW